MERRKGGARESSTTNVTRKKGRGRRISGTLTRKRTRRSVSERKKKERIEIDQRNGQYVEKQGGKQSERSFLKYPARLVVFWNRREKGLSVLSC